jgi:hypothetical protein
MDGGEGAGSSRVARSTPAISAPSALVIRLIERLGFGLSISIMSLILA